MNDQKPTPQESMAIITRMIEASKQRRSMPDLRISVMWAVLTIVTALIVLLVRLIHYTPWINFVWFAIPVIGLPANYFLVARSKADKGAKTAIDVLQRWNMAHSRIHRHYAHSRLSCVQPHGLSPGMACNVFLCLHRRWVRRSNAGSGAQREFLYFRRNVLDNVRIRVNSNGNLQFQPAHRLCVSALHPVLPADVYCPCNYHPQKI